jgi:hypothetical protein
MGFAAFGLICGLRSLILIVAANRRRGFSSSGVRAMLRDWMNQRRLMAQYPLND